MCVHDPVYFFLSKVECLLKVLTIIQEICNTLYVDVKITIRKLTRYLSNLLQAYKIFTIVSIDWNKQLEMNVQIFKFVFVTAFCLINGLEIKTLLDDDSQNKGT